ncbi:MAG: hypothetical protein ACRBK7_18360 [Acidimicrobiales bacterium]
MSTRGFLWVRTSDATVRADGPSSGRSAARFTVEPGDGATIALKATTGGRKNLLAVPNDADQTLKAKGGDGKRPRLLAKPGRDGTFRFESAKFPGRYLRADGSTIDSGGTASSGDETVFEVVLLT